MNPPDHQPFLFPPDPNDSAQTNPPSQATILQSLQNQAKDRAEKLYHTLSPWRTEAKDGTLVSVSECKYCPMCVRITMYPGDVAADAETYGQALHQMCPSEDDHAPTRR